MERLTHLRLRDAIERAAGAEQWEAVENILWALPPLSANGPWIAGGFLRRALANEDLLGGDIDYFFQSDEQRQRIDASFRNDYGLTPIYENDNATTFVVPVDQDKIQVQLIKIRTYPNIAECVGSFDFTVAMFGTDGEDLVLGEWSLWDLARKRLVVNRITYAMASVRRMMKYQKQGYYTCPGAITTLLEEVAEDPSIINSEVHYVD